jgi:TolB-like protein
VIDRCLAADPAGRYSSTRDLATELRAIQEERRRDGAGALTRRRALWLGATAMAAAAIGAATWRFWPAGPAIRTIAVLPFANPLRDEGADYLCEGITDSLIRRIAALQQTRVVALSAVMHFKGQTTEARAVGRQLNADAVVVGSVKRRGGRLIVTAEIVDVATGARLWGNVFDRPEADVLAVHDEIAAAIIEQGIHIPLDKDREGRFGGSLTDDPRAYDLYLQAVHYFRLEREDDYLTARDLLTRAVAQAPTFALAYVTLASTYSVMAIDGYESPKKAWPQSMRNVTRALDLDPDLPDAHAEATASAFFYRWDWAAAEREWQAATRSRRSEVQPELLSLYALQKWALGDNDTALQFARAARLADPLSAVCIVREADLLARTGQFDAAAALYERVIHNEGDDERGFTGLAEVRRMQGRFDEAIAVRRRAYQAAGDESLETVFDGARGADGYRLIESAEARLRLAALSIREADGLYVSPLEFARVHALLGDAEKAFRFLAAAFDERAAGLVFLNVDPSWATVREEPQFRAVVRKVGLEER